MFICEVFFWVLHLSIYMFLLTKVKNQIKRNTLLQHLESQEHMLSNSILYYKNKGLYFHIIKEWVNLSKRGGKDGVFRALAGPLRGISRG